MRLASFEPSARATPSISFSIEAVSTPLIEMTSVPGARARSPVELRVTIMRPSIQRKWKGTRLACSNSAFWIAFG